VLTQCPGCRTVFRITGAILRAAHGQVRCGNCNTQFDAIQHALDEDLLQEQQSKKQAESEATEFMPSRTQRETTDSDDAADFMAAFNEDSTHNEQITMEGDRVNPPEQAQKIDDFMVDESLTEDSIVEVFNIASEEWNPPVTPPSDVTQTRDTGSQSATSITSPEFADELTRVRQQFFGEVDEKEEAPLFQQSADDSGFDQVFNETQDVDIKVDADSDAFNESVYMAQFESALKDTTGQPIHSQSDVPDEISVVEKTRMRRWGSRRKQNQEPPPDVLDPDQLVKPISTPRWPLILGCLSLSLLLTFQILHHYRQTLVRHPSFGPMLKSVYSVFGKSLEPRWEVSAYTIKQWGIVSDPQEPGVLRVRASITNNAAFAQPYPLLKLTLEDRFGTHLGTRAFKPAEYLPAATNAAHLLAAGLAANVDLAIVDPGEDAVGFQFDSCLGNDNAMRCAHE